MVTLKVAVRVKAAASSERRVNNIGKLLIFDCLSDIRELVETEPGRGMTRVSQERL